MAGSLHSLLLLETCHAVCELIKLCVLWMDVIHPGVLLCDGRITGGILIVRAIGLNQMPLSMMRKAGARREFAVVLFLKAWTAVCAVILHVSTVFTRWTNRETANRKVRTHQATCVAADTHNHERGCLVCGFCVGWGWGGSTPRQRVWERRQEISLCDTKLFIDTGRVEMDPNGSLCLTAPLHQFVSRKLYILFSISLIQIRTLTIATKVMVQWRFSGGSSFTCFWRVLVFIFFGHFMHLLVDNRRKWEERNGNDIEQKSPAGSRWAP